MLLSKKFLLVLLFCIPLLSVFSIPFSYAYNTTNFSLPVSVESIPIQNSNLDLINGGFIYGYIDDTNNNIVLQIYSNVGTLLSTTNLAIPSAFVVGTSMISMVQYSASIVYIIWIGHTANSVSPYAYIYWFSVNINTYATTTVANTGVYGMSSATKHISSLSQLFYYSGKYYVIVNIHCSTGGDAHDDNIWLVEMTLAGAPTVKTDLDMNGGVNTARVGVYGFYDITTTTIYFMTANADDLTLAHYYRANLSTFTVELLATQPNQNRITTDSRMNFITGGINISSGDVFLYFQSIAPRTPSSIPTFTITETIMQFNNTIIYSDVLHVYELVANLVPSLPSSSTSSWCIGITSTIETFFILYPSIIASVNTYFFDTLTITNVYDYSLASISISSSEEAPSTMIIPFTTVTDIIYKNPSSQFQTNIVSSTVYIYYGLAPLTLTYSYTLTYTPIDSPLYTLKSYRFSLTTLANGVPVITNVVFYIDNGQITTGHTNSNGLFELTISLSQNGIHTFLFEIYDSNSINIFNVTRAYTYIDESVTIPSPNQGFAFSLPMIMTFLPITILVLVPMLFLGVEFGFSGFVIGGIIGLFMGVSSGFIPMYMMYLLMFGLVLVFIAYIKSGSGDSD